MSEELEIQQGEGKWIRFTVTQSGAVLDLSGAECFFGVKTKLADTAYLYSAEDNESSKWDKTNAATGIVRVNIPATTTKSLAVGKYDAQARFILTADTDVDKTQKLTLKIVPAIIHD